MIPKKRQIYNFFDDGKCSSSRLYKAYVKKVIKSREITRKIIGKSISELTEEELDAKSTMVGTFIRTDSVSVNKEIKYLKIGEEFDDCPIFYIDPKKRYIVTCYNNFIIYVIKSGYSTNASGKFNQIY